ncbi:MAG: MmcQ/YjbR family DNA-binding protein [Bacteroidales bacterium]|nr:MmcQ/YjbR family DNA-binding protein [Bacteroidales bacterium]MBR4391307.1 MmcQ/YjbR family DNA-binding protein [Bacteroidales bacterium]
MNIEAFREYCLSLGDVEEKLPFAKMPGGDTVLAFYVKGHTFCYCDIDDFRTVIVKCQPERIPELIESTKGICQPDSHFNAKYWIGLEMQVIETETLKALVANSYEIVGAKYKRKRN